MPNWREVLSEIERELAAGNQKALDTIRHKYLEQLHRKLDRNIITYYSGWLQKPNLASTSINDDDKNAFMLTVHKLDRTKGLDIIIHTPGGDIAATESIVDYLHQMFGNNIRAIVPQISMSAGTMIALSCKQIVMGKQSNLGPIDPQMGGVPCQGVLEEFEQAQKDAKSNPHSIPFWQTIISKYHPTFIGSCRHAIAWSDKLVSEWLERNMCTGNPTGAQKILKEFSDHRLQKSHARHISTQRCKEVGLNILDMEADNDTQDLILTIHHAYMHSFSHSTAVKLVENHLGISHVTK